MMSDLITPIRRLKDNLPHLLDPKMGIITGVSEHPLETDSPRFFRYNGSAANTVAFGDYQNFAIGGGAATTRELALVKTVGECVERYSAAIYDKKNFPLCSFNDASFPCVHPSKFALYSKEQYEHEEFDFDEFTVDSPVRWTQATNMATKEIISVPASMVYVPYFFYENGDETPIIQPISTGLSCHCSYQEAVVGGICEVIERDNFMITWQAKLSRTKIRHESLSAENKDLIQRFEEVGYEVHLMDISNETKITGILAVATSKNTKFVPLVVAASVSLDPEEAVRKALEELAHTERYAYQIRNELPRLEVHEEFDNVLGQVHHVNFWMDSEIGTKAEFLYGSNNWMDFSELIDYAKEVSTPTEEMNLLTSILKESGFNVLVTEITSIDVKSLGMNVIRAIIPGYHPLFMGYHKRPLGSERLWTLPQKLGFEGIQRETGDYPYPHPFP